MSFRTSPVYPSFYTPANQVDLITSRGVIAIIGLGLLSSYTGFVIGQLKQRYIHTHSMADAGEILLGRFGQSLFGTAQLVFSIFIMASHILAFPIIMNVLTDHGACTIVFGLVGIILSFFLSLPRRLEDISYLSIVSFAGIAGAALTTIIRVPTPYRIHPIELFPPKPSFYRGFLAIANIMFAYASHVAFFTLFSEFRDSRDFSKSLALLQVSDVLLYTTAAIVIYFFAGLNVASPILILASPVLRRVVYGFAILTVCPLSNAYSTGKLANALILLSRLSLAALQMGMWRQNSYMSASSVVET